MCTLTILPVQTGPARSVRIACNRDESRSRPDALPPVVRAAGQRQIILPVDPQSGGTWIGASDAGLAAVLLNAYPAGSDPEPLERAAHALVSRGTIIPALLESSRFEELVQRAQSIDASRHAPFRLVLVGAVDVAECAWAGRHVQLKSRSTLTGPMMFTSSGLGDQRVEHPRRELFRHWFHGPGDWPAEQDAFHRHQWPDAPELSVCMNRPEACTVSYTVVEIAAKQVTLIYHPQPPNRPSPAIVASTPLRDSL